MSYLGKKIKKMQKKVDTLGLEYYPELPEGYRLATIDDFHTRGRKKIGMEYLVHTYHSNVFEVRMVSEDLKGEMLVPFFKEGRIYIKVNETVLQN
jgi:hypothetical protein